MSAFTVVSVYKNGSTSTSNFSVNGCLPPSSPFLIPTEEFLSACRWKVYDRNPYTRVNFLQAMELACGDIGSGTPEGFDPVVSLLTLLSCDGYCKYFLYCYMQLQCIHKHIYMSLHVTTCPGCCVHHFFMLCLMIAP